MLLHIVSPPLVFFLLQFFLHSRKNHILQIIPSAMPLAALACLVPSAAAAGGTVAHRDAASARSLRQEPFRFLPKGGQDGSWCPLESCNGSVG